MKYTDLAKLLSNYGSRLWGMISVFIFVPIYIKILGIENYAVIGFYTLLLGIISFADSGLSSAIIKEFSLNKTPSYKYSVFRRMELLYLSICFLIVTIIFSAKGFISQHWLTSNSISLIDLKRYIALIGIGTTLQLLSSFYFGALFGLGEQIRSNTLQIIWNVCRAGFVVIILKYYSSSLDVYFIWQIICNIIYIFILRAQSISFLKGLDNNIHNYLKKIPTHILKYVGSMSLIAIISAVNTQADKIITSSLFSLKDFGYYNIASLISQVPVMFATPIVTFAFPFLSKFANENKEKFEIVSDKISILLSIIVFPLVLVLIVFTKEILFLWNGKNIEPIMVNNLLYVIRILSSGTLFLALQLPLFYMLLSYSKTNYTIIQGVFQIVIGVPLLYYFSYKYGMTAVPYIWLIINFGGWFYLLIIVYQKLQFGNFKNYLIYCILLPGFISLLSFILVDCVYVNIGGFSIIYIASAGILSVLLCLIILNKLCKRNTFNFTYYTQFPI